jgi:SAM-dependent methyltransferase
MLELLTVSVPPDGTALDIGCGVGRLTRVLAARADRAVGIDVSAEMLDRAGRYNAHLPNVRWVQGDGVSLAGIDDASIDAVVSHVVFQHIPDPTITLGYVREMGRVLRPGGWAGFQVSNDPSVHRPRTPRRRGFWDRFWEVMAIAARRRPRGQDDPAWLGSAVELDALRAAADSAGLQVERVVGEGTQFCLILARRRADG